MTVRHYQQAVTRGGNSATALTRQAKSVAAKLAGILSSLLIAWAAASSAPTLADSMDSEDHEEVSTPLAIADSSLQQGLERIVRQQGLWRHVESRKLALGLVDITDLNAPRYAALNPDHMMYAASLPKIAILLGAFVKIGNGELTLDDNLREEMTRMIRYSDNGSATRVLEKVGRQDLIEILISERLRLYDPSRDGGLWVGKDYARKNAYRRDPLHNISHGASVYQVVRFFYLLETGELVDPRYQDDMKEILSKPGISHKFVAGLKGKPGIEMYRKSGSWRDFHADAALVETGEQRYIMVGLIQHPDGGKWLTRLAAPMHDLVIQRRTLDHE